jgi:hypothetical protein
MIEAQTQMLLDILEVSQRNRRAIRKGAETDLPKSSGRFYFIVEIADQESCLGQQQRG